MPKTLSKTIKIKNNIELEKEGEPKFLKEEKKKIETKKIIIISKDNKKINFLSKLIKETKLPIKKE